MSDLIRTSARLSLGQRTRATRTSDQLSFQLDHALARDAVHAQLNVSQMMDGLAARGLRPASAQSAASNRRTYLLRPDLGRKLSAASREELESITGEQAPDLSLVVADGLSAFAAERHALPLLDALLPLLRGWTLAPVVVATSARVALGDEIGELLHARVSVMLIGERPGLSSPYSLGVYITWSPRRGRTDAERNCISNVRLEGLSYTAAAERIAFYLHEAKRLQITGVTLKERSKGPLETGSRE